MDDQCDSEFGGLAGDGAVAKMSPEIHGFTDEIHSETF